MSLRIHEPKKGAMVAPRQWGLVWGPQGGQRGSLQGRVESGLGPLCPGPLKGLQGGSDMKETSAGRGDTCRHIVTIQHNEQVLPEAPRLWRTRRRMDPEDPGCRQGQGSPVEEGGRFGMSTIGRGGLCWPEEGQESREGRRGRTVPHREEG